MSSENSELKEIKSFLGKGEQSKEKVESLSQMIDFLIEKIPAIADTFQRRIIVPVQNNEMSSLEKSIAVTTLNIMDSYPSLRDRPAAQRKNWAEGFYNGYIYAMDGIKKRSEIQMNIWECDYKSTQEEKSRGIVIGIKFVLDDIDSTIRGQ